MTATNLTDVTRIEVIEPSQRVFIRRYATPGVEVHVQDDGRTLKLLAGTPLASNAGPTPMSAPAAVEAIASTLQRNGVRADVRRLAGVVVADLAHRGFPFKGV